MKKTKERSVFMKTKKIIIALLIIFAVCFIAGEITDRSREATTDYGWELILVNSDNNIPEDYEVSLLTLSNGQQVDERIYPDLQKMFDDMRKEGHRPLVKSGYRSAAEQKAILREKTKEYTADGYPKAVAEKLAKSGIEPGTEEFREAQKKLISDAVKAVNAGFPNYKHISDIIIREKEFEKTTTRKIKRNAPENLNEG